jgi:hypothetical protein
LVFVSAARTFVRSKGAGSKENAMNRCPVLFVPIVPGGRLQRLEAVGLMAVG